MKKIFILFCALSVSYAVTAQANISAVANNDKTTTVAAEVVSLKETEYDFGKIPQGKPVTHVFMFTNTGATPLKLDNVQASCGCTTPEWSKDEVAPGATSKITVGYNAASDGPFTKFITITYNGTQNKQVTIKGEVWKTPTTSAPENTGLSSLKNQ
jgi:Protein of unknown function (DUF1573).